MRRRKEANRAEAIVRAVGALVMLVILAIGLPMMPQMLKGKDPQEMMGMIFKMIVGFGAVAVAVLIIGLIVWQRVRAGGGRPTHTLPTDLTAHESSNACPVCREPMVLRKGKWGAFWGCSTYPKCRGKREVV